MIYLYREHHDNPYLTDRYFVGIPSQGAMTAMDVKLKWMSRLSFKYGDPAFESEADEVQLPVEFLCGEI